MGRITALIFSLIASASLSNFAQAKLVATGESYFIVEHEALVPLDATASYRLLGKPSQWWSSAHTWSGDANNMSMKLRAGACFCESWNGNSVTHGQVIMARPGSMLRLQGALGPLQDMAVNAVLSFTLKKEADGTKVILNYRVSGDASLNLAAIAPIVDKVLGEQLEGFHKAASK
jgi:hypothetical protein